MVCLERKALHLTRNYIRHFGLDEEVYILGQATKFEISVIVAIYNAQWNKLKKTLLSILMQEGVEFEIILADDGSKVKFREETLALFAQYGFLHYKFSDMEQNGGTCLNILAALGMAQAPYIKTISPGDLIFQRETLKNWLTFMKARKADISFGNSVYYSYENEKPVIQKMGNCPKNKTLFSKEVPYKLKMLDFLIAGDLILGASLMVKTELFCAYLKLLVENGVIYGEDNFLRLAVFEGKQLLYYPETVIFYENGTGISTSGNSKWQLLLLRDEQATGRALVQYGRRVNAFSDRYLYLLKTRPHSHFLWKIYKYLLFPEAIPIFLKNKIRHTETETDVSGSSFVELLK